MKNRRNVLLADMSLFAIAIIWGLGFPVMKTGVTLVTPFWFMALRFLSALAILLLLAGKKLRRTTVRDVRDSLLPATALFLSFLFLTIGLKESTASKQAFLSTVYVILVPFISWVIYRRFPGFKVLGTSCLCLAGIGLLSLREGFALSGGDAWSLAGALMLAFQILCVEKIASRSDAVVAATLQIAWVALFSTVMALGLEPFPPVLSRPAWASLLYAGFFSTSLGLLVQNLAQKFTPSTHASVLMSLESLFGALFGILLLGEIFTTRMACGGALIFLSALLTSLDLPLTRRRKLARVGASSSS